MVATAGIYRTNNMGASTGTIERRKPMTVEEIKNLPNGTRLIHDGDDLTVFTKDEGGIWCNYMNINVKLMPWEVVQFTIKHWSVKKNETKSKRN